MKDIAIILAGVLVATYAVTWVPSVRNLIVKG